MYQKSIEQRLDHSDVSMTQCIPCWFQTMRRCKLFEAHYGPQTIQSQSWSFLSINRHTKSQHQNTSKIRLLPRKAPTKKKTTLKKYMRAAIIRANSLGGLFSFKFIRNIKSMSSSSQDFVSRPVIKKVFAKLQKEGDGAVVRRGISRFLSLSLFFFLLRKFNELQVW